MSLRVPPRAARLLAAGAVVAAAMACEGDRSSVLAPNGPVSLGSPLLTDGRNIPTGQVVDTVR